MRRNLIHLLSFACLLAVLFIVSPAGTDTVHAANDPFSLTDHSGYCGKHTMWNFDEETGTLTIAGEGDMSSYSPWKDYKDQITAVVIKSGVTSIGNYNFNGYDTITSVKIASSVESIGKSAFRFCTGLKKITIASGVTSIGDCAFYGCENLKKVTFSGSSLQTIGKCAFSSCTSLADVGTLPSGLKKIGASAFQDTAITAITIPQKVTSIGSYAFAGCSALTAIKVSGKNTKYSAKSGVLYNADKTKLIVYPAGKTAESFTIPASVTTISAKAFAKNKSLQTVYVGTGTQTIGGSAFSGCSTLSKVVFRCAAPTFKNRSVFKGVEAKAQYPVSESDSWSASVQADYGGDLTWTSYRLSVKYADVTLSKTSYVYNADKVRKPSVSVTVNGKTLTKGTDYTLTYADGRTKIGAYAVTISGTGDYTGEVSTSFTIVPGKVVLTDAASGAKKKLTVSWETQQGSVRYEIAYRKKGTSTWKKKTVDADTLSKTIGSLTSGKTYYVKVRAYKSVGGTKYYGSWSDKMTVKIK